MRKPTLTPLVADQAPNSPLLTTYDKKHLPVYIRLLDAEVDGADWMEAALTVLRIDPIREPQRAHSAWQSHLSRAKWMKATNICFAVPFTEPSQSRNEPPVLAEPTTETSR